MGRMLQLPPKILLHQQGQMGRKGLSIQMGQMGLSRQTGRLARRILLRQTGRKGLQKGQLHQTGQLLRDHL